MLSSLSPLYCLTSQDVITASEKKPIYVFTSVAGTPSVPMTSAISQTWIPQAKANNSMPQERNSAEHSCESPMAVLGPVILAYSLLRVEHLNTAWGLAGWRDKHPQSHRQSSHISSCSFQQWFSTLQKKKNSPFYLCHSKWIYAIKARGARKT